MFGRTFESLFFLRLHFIYVLRVRLRVNAQAPTEGRRGYLMPWKWSYGQKCCEPPDVGAESCNSGPLEEQEALLTTEKT